MRLQPNPLPGVAAGLFIIGLALAFFFSYMPRHSVLAHLFFALAATTLLGSLSIAQPHSVYSGLHGADGLAGIVLFL